MPLMYCKKCHREWEGGITTRCAWCGTEGYILDEKTHLERGVKFITDTDLGGE